MAISLYQNRISARCGKKLHGRVSWDARMIASTVSIPIFAHRNLSGKRRLCREPENGISVKISANASRDLAVSSQDLVIVIANLFENAIHAAEKLKNKENRVDISIKESVRRLVIKVENPCRNNLTFDESLYGVGIRSVIATANKYDGMYDFTAEDGIFSAKVSLNLE